MLDNETTIPFERLTARPRRPAAPTEHMVRMRDGVRLATDVYLPAGERAAPGPVVLIRLPYDKNGEYTFIPDIAMYMVDARLPRGHPGRARQVPVRGRGDPVDQRGLRRLRHDRLDRRAGVVGRRGRDVGRLVLRLHAAGRGVGRAPRAAGDRAARDRDGARRPAGPAPGRADLRGRDGRRAAVPGHALPGQRHLPLGDGLERAALRRRGRALVRHRRRALAVLRPDDAGARAAAALPGRAPVRGAARSRC